MPRHPNAVELPEKREAHAKHFRNPDGTFNAEFSGGPIHYRATPGGPWLDKKHTFKVGNGSRGADHFVSDESDTVMETYRIGQGSAARWWVEIRDTLTGQGIRYRRDTRPTVTPGQDRLDAPGADVSWRYQHTRRGGKMESLPVATKRGPQTYTFSYELVGGAPPLQSTADGGLESPGVFKLPRAFSVGANGMEYSASAYSFTATTISMTVDDTDFPSAALPYVIDPTTPFDINLTANDGRSNLQHSGPAYTDTNTGGAVEWTDTTQGPASHRSWPGSVFSIQNNAFRWDTSSIADTDIVTGATFRFTASEVNNANTRQWGLEWFTGTWGDAESTVLRPNEVAGWTPNALAYKSLSNYTLGQQYTETLVNAAANVNKAGYTALRGNVDDNGGVAPTGNNNLSIASWDNTTYTVEPRLSVDYVTPTQVVVQVSASADDNRVRRTATGSGNYANVPSGTIGWNATVTRTGGNRSWDGTQYIVQVFLMRFNTGAQLPDDCTITSANLELYREEAGQGAFDNVDSRNLRIDYDSVGWDASSSSDWSMGLSGTAHAGTSISTMSSVSTWYSFALSNPDANISKTSTTSLKADVDGGQPTGLNQFNVANYDSNLIGPSGAPRLRINYTTGDTTPPSAPTGLTATAIYG